MLFQGDVRIVLGVGVQQLAQAVVWVQTLGGPAAVGADDADRRVRQIAVHFDRVSDPGVEAGFAQAGDRLLVTRSSTVCS